MLSQDSALVLGAQQSNASHLHMSVWPSGRYEGDGVFSPQGHANAMSQSLILSYSRLYLGEFLDCRVLIQSVNEHVNVARPGGSPVTRRQYLE